MTPEMLSLVMMGAMILLIIFGGHVAAVLGAVGIIFALIAGRADLIALFPNRLYTIMTSFALEAVPLFVFMGVILERSGVAERLYGALHVAMGGTRGGLLLATMVFSTLFAACTGILGAITVMMGLIALPAMLKANYEKEIAAGTICAGAALGIVIPPSIMLILYGPCAGVSIAKLFFACLIPGLILSAIYIIYILVRCYLNPKVGPPLPIEERRKVSGVELFRMILTSVAPALLLILAVLGSILFGVASPTEAASVGAVGALVICAAYGKLTWDTMKACCWFTIKVCAFIMLIVAGAGMFTTVFMGLGGDVLFTNFMLGLHLGVLGTTAILLGIIFILGMFMDWIGLLMVFVPLSIPIVSALGVDPLWFAVLFCITLQISCITPPFSYTAFYLRGIAPPEVTLGHIYRGLFPFVPLQLVALVLFYIFPALSTWFPSLVV